MNYLDKKVPPTTHTHNTVYSIEWSLGAELWIGVESNFRVAKILITPADSVYLTFSNICTGLF